jgi:hypothetical protein
MPFCQVRRLTTPKSGASARGSSPRRACRAALLAGRFASDFASKRSARWGSFAGSQ